MSYRIRNAISKFNRLIYYLFTKVVTIFSQHPIKITKDSCRKISTDPTVIITHRQIQLGSRRHRCAILTALCINGGSGCGDNSSIGTVINAKVKFTELVVVIVAQRLDFAYFLHGIFTRLSLQKLLAEGKLNA